MKTKLPYLLVILLISFTQCKRELIAPNSALKLKATARKLYAPPTVTEYPITAVQVSSTTQGLVGTNAIDGNPGTLWSSSTSSTNHTEWINFHFDTAKVNYIKLTPRFNNGPGLGFPVEFTIYYSTGNTWVYSSYYNSFPTPTNNGNHKYPVILPLPAGVRTDGIMVEAWTLGKDDVNNYVFQLGEVVAGYNTDFEHFQFQGNDGTALFNRINNTGSDSFDPNKALNFTRDERGPLISAMTSSSQKNIYAPNIVNNSGSAWNIYFGGWDIDETAHHDNVLMTVTHDDFMNFDTHARAVTWSGTSGGIQLVNNPSVLKLGPSLWRMNYTQAYTPTSGNHPAYSTSTDGASWTPYYSLGTNILNMSGYPNWSSANINGSNVMYVDNSGLAHLFFTDFSTTIRIHHATSTDFVNYTYVGDVNSTDAIVCTDMKSFITGDITYYFAVSYNFGNTVKFNLSTDLYNWPAATQSFANNYGPNDYYITTIGLVAANNRLYGMLYGAGPVSSLDQNSIFAIWLTKKITFISDETGNTWGGNGNAEYSHGPNQVVMPMTNSFTTGHYNVYDTDGYTLLFSSPQISIRSGDIWKFIP